MNRQSVGRVRQMRSAPMKADPLPDERLLDAHLQGDDEAFGVLYDRYDRQCFHFIRRLLGSAQGAAAEDLHQETWEAVALKGRSYAAAKASFGTWLLTIARNKVLDHFRRQKVAVLVSAEEAVEAGLELADPSQTPPDRVQSREMAMAMILAVERLPLVQREAFLLFAEGGLSLEEIAQATDVGIETAKSRLRYARSSLRVSLASWRPDHG